MNEDQKQVYRMVQGSRERVFRWLESLPPGVLTQQHPDFAYGSLRNIHAHVADCYCNWLSRGGVALAARTASAAEELPDVTALRSAFAEVDRLMEQAFGEFTDLDTPLEIMWRCQPLKVTCRWLLMHPLTHEFHHKGQMLALGRVLGHPYPPGPDTDLLLPFETP
ncbi:DinB family protein [Deinococcus radiophilus]|uniref:DUF664 domain-containing protein n=1 Tax=Deinococcus radiophilus TaxID=32062 RepID=A0A431VUI1_9DEIO|nr:DinB family protein [Deinococcus radiophilus]RTR26853.1 DUF664 domain-containing protein [Deinococcus radiophilus]UFA51781.1 DinB family protein [Deinococcus radiophilus]